MPLCELDVAHVAVDTAALYRLLRRLDLWENVKQKEAHEIKQEMWAEFFKVAKVESNQKQFS